MSKKANPIILRINKTYIQKSKYIEKKPLEQNFYSFQDLEIRKFIKQFFKTYGLMIQELRLCFFNQTLSIFISYFSTTTTNSIILTKINNEKKAKVIRRKVKSKYKKGYLKLLQISKKRFKYKKLNHLSRTKNTTNNLDLNLKNRSWLMQNYNNFFESKKYKNIANINSNNFLKNFFKSLSLFTKNKLNFSLTLKHINTEIKNEIIKKNIKALNKSLVKLRKYQENKFFKEGVNIMFFAVTNKNSAELLANFIANELQKLKRHNFFVRFIKNTLTLFNTKTFSRIQGIKIKIKGRFNGAPRARHKIIEIGNSIPTLSLDTKIDYSETTAFTANGTFGVKVWICEKS